MVDWDSRLGLSSWRTPGLPQHAKTRFVHPSLAIIRQYRYETFYMIHTWIQVFFFFIVTLFQVTSNTPSPLHVPTDSDKMQYVYVGDIFVRVCVFCGCSWFHCVPSHDRLHATRVVGLSPQVACNGIHAVSSLVLIVAFAFLRNVCHAARAVYSTFFAFVGKVHFDCPFSATRCFRLI